MCLAVTLCCATARVAAQPAQHAAAEDVPIIGGSTARARSLGLDPAPDRAQFVPQLARIIYDVPEGKREGTETLLSNQYLLGYPPSNVKRDGTVRHIKVQVDGYKQVRARETYRAGARQ